MPQLQGTMTIRSDLRSHGGTKPSPRPRHIRAQTRT
jgi:hypothetical protein